MRGYKKIRIFGKLRREIISKFNMTENGFIFTGKSAGRVWKNMKELLDG
jgi:hypothetical protein